MTKKIIYLGVLTLLISCKKEVEGCTYSFATNFNVEATYDDGSCILPVIDESLQIGDFYEGGVVIWLNESKDHGVVCATEDLPYTTWGDVSSYSGTSDSIGTGVQNTINIANENLVAGTAVDQCVNYVSNGYSDWALPSIKELELIATHKTLINNTSIQNGGDLFQWESYWSSTEYGTWEAYSCNINTGVSTTKTRNNYQRVRAIRAF